MSVVPDPDSGGQPGGGGADEASLVAQALAGDRNALGVLVTRYAAPVRRVTRAILGDAEEAEDAAQDAFLLALLKLDQFDRARSFGPWLMRVVTNAAIDRGRRRRIRRTRQFDDDVATATPAPDVEGYSHGEIAEMLGVARGTVRSAVFHARRRLRRLLQDWRDEA